MYMGFYILLLLNVHAWSPIESSHNINRANNYYHYIMIAYQLSCVFGMYPLSTAQTAAAFSVAGGNYIQ